MYVSVSLYHSGNPISNSSETSSRGQVARPQLVETTDLTVLGKRTHDNVMFKTTGVIAITTPPSPTPCSDDEEMFMSFKKITGVGRMETCENLLCFLLFLFCTFFSSVVKFSVFNFEFDHKFRYFLVHDTER